MRDLIDLLEIAGNSDAIDRLIKKSRFSKHDINEATNGQCAGFAIALYRTLISHGIDAELVFFVEGTDGDGRSGEPQYSTVDGRQIMHWRHAAVRSGSVIYDIRGRVDPSLVHKDFYTAHVIPSTETEVLDEIKAVYPEYGFKRDRTADWSQRLWSRRAAVDAGK